MEFRGRNPREFHKPAEGKDHLITNLPQTMLLVCNSIVDEGFQAYIICFY